MIRSTFLAFETAKKALSASQAGLDTTGHNMANVNTTGYTRQRVDQVSVSLSGYRSKYSLAGKPMPGLGSDISGINQVRDKFLDTRYRNEAENYGQLTIKSEGLQDLESLFDELQTTGLHAQMSEFIKQLQGYHDKASQSELAVLVRTAATQFTSMLNTNATELQTLQQQQRFDLQVTTEEKINIILKDIASLNKAIREDNIYGGPANELNDQRNLLLDELSQYMNIHVERKPEKVSGDLWVENVTVSLKGSQPNIELVNNSVYNQIKASPASVTSTEPVIIQLADSAGYPLKDFGNITSSITGGAIQGYLDIINGKGEVYAQGDENTYRGIPYYQESLNTLARTFAKVMNTLNSISATEAQPPEVLEQEKNLFGPTGGGTIDDITASNIQISNEWKDNANWLTTTKKPPVAADQDGKTTIANDNLLAMLNRLKGNHVFSSETGVPQFSGSFQEYMVSFKSELGQDIALNTSMLTTSTNIISSIADQRDSISAVSMDEEGINMLTFSKYFNAASRYMTTLDEALGTIIQSMGVVGR